MCIIQVAQELLQLHAGKPLQLVTVKNVKFLAVIDPTVTPQVRYTLTRITPDYEGNIKAMATVTANDTALAKISFTCRPY